MARHHLIQISDLHLSEQRAYNQDGWEACLAYIESEAPDFVAVTGDHILDDPDAEDDHLFAAEQLKRIPVAWAAIPGNHDIGDTNPHPYFGQHLSPARLKRYRDIFGYDRWCRDAGRWRLIGLNAFLFGSDLPEEDDQYDWFRAQTRKDPGRPTALFLHKPLCINSLYEESSPDVCILPEGRRRLMKSLQGVNLRLIASGHNHHYRSSTLGTMAMVWAPSTAQILRMPRDFRALLRPGVVHYWFDDEGGLEFLHAEPPGIAAIDITDFIDRYGAMRSAPMLPLQPPPFGEWSV